MSEYLLLEQNTTLTKKEIINKYNELIQDIWFLEHKIHELNEDYDLMTKAYEDVANELYG
jgi:hypothetical protein